LTYLVTVAVAAPVSVVGMTSLVVAARACPHKKETTRRMAPVEVILAIRCDDECQVGDDLGLGRFDCATIEKAR
jgi:hypothetical protein